MSDESPVSDAQKRRAFDAVYNAVRKYNAGLEQDERCTFCNEVLVVDGLPKENPSQWMVHCPCGKSNTTLKGL